MLELPAPQPWVEPHRRRWVRRRCEPRAPALDREAELAALARGSGPLRRALARVAGRMVATRSWERLGFARLEDYAAERGGMSARELRDLALVDRALAELPEVDAAFRAGAIGWTRTRLLCRVANVQSQRAWLAAATRLSARALAREVRAVDRCAHEAAMLPDGERRVGVVLHCTPEARARWWHARQIASRVAGHALSAEAFAEAVAAEVWSALRLDEVCDDANRVPSDAAPADLELRPIEGESGPPPGAAPAPLWITALERDLDTADAFELDARLRRAVRLEARRLARVAMLLERVVARGQHRDLAVRGLDAYAEQRLDMAPSRARALLRVARAARRCPELGHAFGSGRLSWVQAHALVPLLLEPGAKRHRASWVAHAARVSVRRLRDDVEVALATGSYAPGDALQTGAISRSRGESARLFFAAVPEVAHLFRAALATVQRRLERVHERPASPGEALEAMLAHAVATWQPAQRTPRDHAVFDRDGWRCTVPGCSSYRNLQAHHVVFRSAGGSDDLENLTTLCAWHHLRGVHAGTVRCAGAAPAALRFELGVRAGRAPLVAYGPGEVLTNAP